MDRIDLHIEVPAVKFDELAGNKKGETSERIRARVLTARTIQENRFIDFEGIHHNSQMTSKLLEKFCIIDDSGKTLLKLAMDKMGLSARSYARILKVARTVADLDGAKHILPNHIAEAIQYRSMDRNGMM